MYSFDRSSIGAKTKSLQGHHLGLMSGAKFLPDCTAWDIEFGSSHPEAAALATTLETWRGFGNVHQLMDYQIHAAVSCVYRPADIVVKHPTDAAKIVHGVFDYAADANADIGSTAMLDLPPGTGKTLTACIAAVAFADRRGADVHARGPLLLREQSVGRTYCRPVDRRAAPEYADIVLAFCPKHLLHQWKAAAEQAVMVCGSLRVIYVNPLPEVIEMLLAARASALFVYDAYQKVPEAVRFVPIVVVDEFAILSGERTKVAAAHHNYAVAALENPFIAGRVLLVSADAGMAMEHVAGSRNGCILRRLTHPTATLNFNTVADVLTCAGTSSSIRQRASAAIGSDVPLTTHRIAYTSSVGGLLFGVGFEAARRDGATRLSDDTGVDVHGCRDIAALKAALATRANAIRAQPTATPADRKQLKRCVDYSAALDRAEGRECPVCLEDFRSDADRALLGSCWHSVCKDCVRSIMCRDRRCPLCREHIQDCVVAEIEVAPLTVDVAGMDITASIPALLGPRPGMKDALEASVRALKAHASAEEVYRVICIVPAELRFEAFYKLARCACGPDADIIEFRTVGTKAKRVLGSTIQETLTAFSGEAGRPFRILFSTEGSHDSFTGLDLPNVDALICLGAGNSAQRLGRLTRLGRQFKTDGVHVIELIARD